MIPIPQNNRWDKPAMDAALAVFEQIAAQHPSHLVRMFFRLAPAPYEAGKIYGLPPSAALEHYRYQIAIPVGENGDPLDEVPLATAPQRIAAPSAPNVDIPSDWESLHHLKVIRIASDILGTDIAGIKLEHAREVITTELNRRKDQANAPQV